jgi:hypothetical protein
MIPIAKSILNFISNKIFFLLIFCSLIFLDYHSFRINWDLAIQLNTLVNLSKGHGISLNTISDSGRIMYEKCSLWPAGFSIVTYPIFKLLNNSIWSALAVKAISYLFFIIFIDKYLDLLRVSAINKKIIASYFILGILPLISFYPSDVLATVTCLWGFYYHLRFQETKVFINQFKSLILLSLSYFIKYSFFPFMFYPILSFVVKEWGSIFKKWRIAIQTLGLTFSLFTFIYIFNLILVGKLNSEIQYDAFSGKPHWNQLTHFDGFLMSLGHYKRFFINHLLGFGFPIQFGKLSAIITLGIYVSFAYVSLKWRNKVQRSIINESIKISLFAGLLISVFLSLLSLNIPGQTWWTTPYWTYVEETRYFGPVIFIGLINIIFLATQKVKIDLFKIIVTIIFITNGFIYYQVYKKGFYGENFKTFNSARMEILSPIVKLEKDKIILVHDDNSNIYNKENFILQSQGFPIINKSQYRILSEKMKDYIFFQIQKKRNNSFFLKKLN